MKMDKTDKSILNLLQKNARTTNKELAQELGLSTTPIFERVKKLEKNGVIKNYVALVDNKKVDKKLIAFVSIELMRHNKGQLMNFENSISRLKEVMECFHIAGSTDYILKIAVADMEEYHKFLTDRLSAIENIASIDSSFVLTEVKRETAFAV